jgi:hypothetical protein
LKLARGIVDICVDVLSVPRRSVMVEFTQHTAHEIVRDGSWVKDWTPDEAVPAAVA